MTLSAPRYANHRDRQREDQEIARVINRLTQQFPELPPEEIERAVHGTYTSFGDSPIRDFVPVLVERASRKTLADYPHKHYRA